MSKTKKTDKISSHKFQAEVSSVLNLVINSLYSNKEIFLRELISNASDAIDRLKFRAISEPDLLADNPDLVIQLKVDKDAKTITVWDNGIGMTEDQLVSDLGTIAHSGSQDFLAQMAKLQSEGDTINLIGQFGVGFYSSYLVSDLVTVITRPAGQTEAYKWTSDGVDSFTIEKVEREQPGTTVILHVRDEHEEFLNDWRLRMLVSRYSDFVSHPIQMEEVVPVPSEDDDAEDKESTGEEKTETVFTTLNQASALWQRSKDEITDEQYNEFYTHVSHDWEPPLAQTHFQIEGTQMFTGLLFLPKRRPFDLFDRDRRRGLRLYVSRVFIMDDCEELLPPWLRFLRGVVDSDDLPLNVSRELLQDSKVTQIIRKQVIKKTLDLLDEIAKEKSDDYGEFWNNFGVVLKEGLHHDARYRDRLAKLLRYSSSKGEGLVSLEEYVERMAEGQEDIFYLPGYHQKIVEDSPHLEALKSRGYEILFFTDPIDHWVAQALTEFDGKKLVSALTSDLKLDGEEDPDKDKQDEKLKPLLERFEKTLSDRVSKVQISNRLTTSPVCLVIPKGGVPSHIERLLQANMQEVTETKRILEINPTHPLIANLTGIHEKNPELDKVNGWIEMLFDQALLAEGSPISDPGRFATQMTELMQAAVEAESNA